MAEKWPKSLNFFGRENRRKNGKYDRFCFKLDNSRRAFRRIFLLDFGEYFKCFVDLL
jgi:hypothetical protein